jgi:hypothetical protein
LNLATLVLIFSMLLGNPSFELLFPLSDDASISRRIAFTVILSVLVSQTLCCVFNRPLVIRMNEELERAVQELVPHFTMSGTTSPAKRAQLAAEPSMPSFVLKQYRRTRLNG